MSAKFLALACLVALCLFAVETNAQYYGYGYSGYYPGSYYGAYSGYAGYGYGAYGAYGAYGYPSGAYGYYGKREAGFGPSAEAAPAGKQ